MNMNLLISRSSAVSVRTLQNISKCCYAKSSNSSIVSELEVEEVPAYDVVPKYTEEQLEKLRNKSRLEPHHRNILHNQRPYDESMEYYHDTVWYKKRVLGRFGIEAAGVSPSIVWPTEGEVEDKKEFEQVAYPVSIQDLWKEMEETKKKEALAIKKREEEIDKVVANFDKWREALNAKIQKKEAALLEAKQKKERMLEELREQFGYQIDPHDEKFKELLQQKEKEDKKRKKEERKKMKNEKFLAFLQQQAQEKPTENPQLNNESKIEPEQDKDISEKAK